MRRTLLIALLAAASLSAQPASLRDEVLSLYQNFPSETGSQEQVRHLIMLRDYWAQAAKNPAPYIEVLRAELPGPRQPSLFYIDASLRLLTLTDTTDDRKIAVRAMLRANVPEVGPIPYYALVARLATLNEDTSRAAFVLLQWPDFQVRIAGAVHGLDTLFVRLIVATDVKYWADAAIERLETEQNPYAQQCLLLLLWYAQTDFTAEQLKAYAQDTKKPEPARAFAQRLANRSANITAADRQEAAATPEKNLRDAQRDYALRLDIREVERFTLLLAAKREAEAK